MFLVTKRDLFRPWELFWFKIILHVVMITSITFVHNFNTLHCLLEQGIKLNEKDARAPRKSYDNREIKTRVYRKRQTSFCTTWPRSLTIKKKNLSFSFNFCRVHTKTISFMLVSSVRVTLDNFIWLFSNLRNCQTESYVCPER